MRFVQVHAQLCHMLRVQLMPAYELKQNQELVRLEGAISLYAVQPGFKRLWELSKVRPTWEQIFQSCS